MSDTLDPNIMFPVPFSTLAVPSHPQPQTRGEIKLEDYKEIIKSLYLDQDKPLREVMEIMSRGHGIIATQRMYKSRFGKWGFHKNYTRDAIDEITRLSAERATAGKRSVFTMDDRPVNMTRIERSLKRLSASPEKHDHKKRRRDERPRRIMARTPSPAPIPAILNGADEVRIPESVARWMRAYAFGAFEGGIWVLDTPSRDFIYGKDGLATRRRVTRWLRQYSEALTLTTFWETMLQGFKLLGVCNENLPQILQDEDPCMTCDLVFGIVDSCKLPNMAPVMARIIRDNVIEKFGEAHPLSYLFSSLSVAGPELMYEIGRMTHLCLAQCMAEYLGGWVTTNLYMYLQYCQYMAEHGNTTDPAALHDLARISEVRQLRSAGDPASREEQMDVRHRLSLCYMVMGDFVLAEATLQSLKDSTDGLGKGRNAARWTSRYFWVLSEFHLSTGRWAEAADAARISFRLVEVAYGWKSKETFRALERLSRTLRRVDEFYEATVLYCEWSRRRVARANRVYGILEG